MSARDFGVNVPTNNVLPPEWSCEAPSKKVKVELELADEGNWVEIPTNDVETYVAKGEATSIQRACKVQFPTEWAGESVFNLIEHYNPDSSENGLMHARVAYEREDSIDGYVYTHYGWVGGLGHAENDLDSKFWIYDFGELLSGIPITLTFSRPSIESALQKLATEAINGGIPISDVVIKPPESEEEFAQIASVDSGDIVEAYGSRAPYMADATSGTYGETTASALQAGNVDIKTLNIGYEGTKVGVKSFRRNHDTLVEAFEWLGEKTNAEMYFEPRKNGTGLRMYFDVIPNRRRFGQLEVAINEGENFDAWHEIVFVLNNNALYETKPTNTLYLRGEVGEGLLAQGKDLLDDAVSIISGSKPPSKQFPVAKATVPPLIDAAGGTNLAPPPIDVDATTTDEIEAEATKRLRERLSKVSEGHIELKGHPIVQPYDRLDAYETCGDFVELQPDPVIYEIEEVKHRKKYNDIYRTRVRVSIWAPDEDIEVETSMESMEG